MVSAIGHRMLSTRPRTPLFILWSACVLWGILVLWSTCAPAQALQGLFFEVLTDQSAASKAEPTPSASDHIARWRPVDVDADAIPDPYLIESDVLRLNFFDDAAIDVLLEDSRARGADDYTWLGSVLGEDESGGVIIVVKDDVTMISVNSVEYGNYSLRVMPDGQQFVMEIDPALLPGCGTTDYHAVEMHTAQKAATPQSDTSHVYDVLVAYTPAARAAIGGTSAMEAAIELTIAETNDAYTFSGVNVQARLVHTVEVSYTEQETSEIDLGNLTTTDDEYMDNIHALRNTHGADFVALVTNQNDVCGIGWVPTEMESLSANDVLAFSITVQDCLGAGEYTFAHEIGHNMGCKHAVGDGDPALTRGDSILHTYSYGWRWTGNSNTQPGWRSIMAYSPGTRTARFSNPNVLFDGVATGVAIGEADEAANAQSINTVVDTVTNYRQTATPLVVTPESGLSSAGVAGGSFSPASKTYTLRNISNSTINWTAGKTQSWVSLSLTSGPLSSGSTATVVASINSGANGLSLGSYSDTVTFTDTTNSDTVTRDILLEVVSYFFNLDSSPGWTTTEAWAFGEPQGAGGDPSSGQTGSNVYGYNLAGDYTNNMSEEYLTTPALDLSGHTGVTLSFWRWLGVESNNYDHAIVQVSNDGSSWTTKWANGGTAVDEISWSKVTHDISSVADGQSTVYVRWVMGPTNNISTYHGWNIDDIAFAGVVSAPTNLSEAWVDFAFSGTEQGTSENPFDTLGEAVLSLTSNGSGVIQIKGNTGDSSSDETLTISKPMIIQAPSGAVMIGGS